MGQANKLLLPYRKHTVIEETLAQLSGSPVNHIIVVTGYQHEQVEKTIAGHISPRIKIIRNREFVSGRAESIRCAVEHIPEASDAVLFMVADKPTVPTALINRAIERYRKDRPPILYVMTPTGRGHPIIFSRKLFPELLLLRGDCVGEDLVAEYKSEVIEVYDGKLQIDVDTEDDYRILLKNESGK